MYGNGGYTGDDRMCDLVSDRFAVLQVMSRFGIALGFGDKTIAEVCGEHRVDTATFLAVVNKLLGLGFGTQTAMQELSVRALTDYLHNAHGYFLEFRLPAIRRKLIEAIDYAHNDVSFAIMRFDEYVAEVQRHMDYEEQTVFPYVEGLLEGCASDSYSIDDFRRRHDQVDAKLREQVRYELKKIQTQLGVTTIYVTHDQTEAMTMADHIVLMKDGHIMQQGTPNDLYAHPNSLFVASFVGTPQINKLTCKVVEKGGSLAFQCGELLLSVPDDLTALMQQYKGKEVIVGLRPSELTLAPEGQGEIEGTVDSVEPLGDGFIVYLKAAGQMLVAKIAGGSTVIGKTISLNIEKGKFHIFDSQTEERLNP